MTLVKIPAGQFRMGSERGRSNERPPHSVTLTNAFYMSDREVTVALFHRFFEDPNYPVAEKPKDWSGIEQPYTPTADCPVPNISWLDAVLFCNWLSVMENRTPCYKLDAEANWQCDFAANGYRLPTDAEWEYACRAKRAMDYAFGDDVNLLDDYCHYGLNSERRSWPAGGKLPNGWGLFDMHGNTWERCEDWYDADYYKASEHANPTGPSGGDRDVLRGGSFSLNRDRVRCASRSGANPDYRGSYIGFRVVAPPF